MKLWGRSHSLQRKIITAIVMVGLLPLTLSLILTYFTERRALHETIGANFREKAVEAARRVEMKVTRGINEAEQLAATPFLRTSVTEANRSYAGKEPRNIESMIQDWQKEWRRRGKSNEFPLFINRIVTNYLIRLHDIRRADYLGILVTDNQGALVVSSIPQGEYFHGKSTWWQAAFNKGRGAEYVSEIHFDPSYGTHVLIVAVPIWDDDQRAVIGVVSISGGSILRLAAVALELGGTSMNRCEALSRVVAKVRQDVGGCALGHVEFIDGPVDRISCRVDNVARGA